MNVWQHLRQSRQEGDASRLKDFPAPAGSQFLFGCAPEFNHSYFEPPGDQVLGLNEWRHFHGIVSRSDGNHRYFFRAVGSVWTVKFSDVLPIWSKHTNDDINTTLLHHQLRELILLQGNAEAMDLTPTDGSPDRHARLKRCSVALGLRTVRWYEPDEN